MSEAISPRVEAHLITSRRVCGLLVVYRWLSLAPVVVALASASLTPNLPLSLAAAVALNLIITLAAQPAGAALRRWPLLLLGDLALCGGLIWLSGGWDSPYYLYSFSPLLAAAFFFQWRGAILGAAGMAAFFALAGSGQAGAGPAWLKLIEELTGYFVMATVFGSAATLLARYTKSLVELNRAHRDLEVIHQLTLALQSAADVVEVEECVLEAVTNDLGFPRAVIALVDQQENVLTAWLGKARDGRAMFAGGLPHPIRLPLTPDAGAIAQSLLAGQSQLAANGRLTSNEQVNTYLGPEAYHIFPLQLRQHPVGVLLVDASSGDDPSSLHSLHAVGNQAAVAVGTTMLCVDRAQRLAVQDERIRIARELHDTASQSLFGIVFALDGLGKLLPDQPQMVKVELEQVRDLAETTRAQMRQSIMDLWPSALTAETFEADLRRFVTQTCRAGELQMDVQVRGAFARLSPLHRRSLYRMAQEALTNVVKHAHARRAEVLLEIGASQASLSVRDDGRGFDPAGALARERDRERFGLRGITERAASLGGVCQVISAPGAGATVVTSLPLTDAHELPPPLRR
ncbi:MAG: sensor histidine kinase [Anaerolineales bacterium]|nr:sensor histidine kinase [Anaerolineales bacterium]